MKLYSGTISVSFDIPIEIQLDDEEDIDKKVISYSAYDILAPYEMNTNYIQKFSIDAYDLELEDEWDDDST